MWEGDYIPPQFVLSLFFVLRGWLVRVFLAFLAHLRDDTSQVPSIESVSIVREFLDVFPADLPGMPPDKDIDFCIDL